MKKSLVLLLFIIAILAVPFGIGFITQQRSEELSAHYRLNPAIHAIEDIFKRGWFHSDILSKITVYLPEISAKEFEIAIYQSVRQGPILWGDNRPLAFGFADVKTDIELPTDMQNKLTKALGNMPTISLLSQLHYDGSQDSTLSMSEFTYHKENTQITVFPLKLESHSNLTMNQVQGILHWQGIEVSGANNHMSIGQSLSHVDMQKESVIWTGDMDWHSDDIQFTQSTDTLQIKDINITAQTLMDDQQRVSSTQSLNVNLINNKGIAYGPGKYTITLNHIPLTVFEKLDTMQQKISALPAEQQAQAIKGMGFSMFSLLPDILAAEPEISLHDVSLTTPDGDIQGEFHFTLTGLNQQDMLNFTKIKRHIRADMQVSFPFALLSTANMTKADAFIQKGWLIKENNMLHGTLHMADGVLTINDQAVALPF